MNTHEVEQDILNEIEIKHGINFRLRIESLPIAKKRVAMLAAICSKKDDGLKKMIREIESMDRIVQIDKLIERIRKYNPVGDIEKKSFGEIFTPFPLINNMLDKLPIEVWSDPNLKWGDFCNGVGNFMIIVIKRLMIGLENWQPDEDKRYKHIVENMIYVSELQIKNMFLWMVSIDPRSEFKLNLYRGSSLEKDFDEHMKNVWKVEKLDVMVGNPPYQELKEGFKKSQAIWQLFVEKYLSVLSDGGYLCMVHPDSWRNVDGIFKNIQKSLKEREMLYLEVHDKNDGFKTFGATTTYDFYCVRNNKNNGFKTKIKCVNGEIEISDISKMEFIPNGMFNLYNNLIAKNGEEKVNILYSRTAYGNDKKHMSKIKDNEFLYPCVYYTYKDFSNRLFFSNTNKNGHFNIPKIIFSAGGASTPIIDKTGEYGVMNFACAIIDDISILYNIQKSMLSDEFLKLMSFSDGNSGVGGQRYNRKVISTFRKDFWKDFIDE